MVERDKGTAYRVTGFDVSRTMVELAQRNAAEAGVEVHFRQGSASALPFADDRHRVLRPGGTALVLDLRKDVPMSEIRGYFGKVGLSTINRWMTLAAFRFMLLKRAYTPAQREQMLADIPFWSKEIRLVDIGVELWLQK
jgi:ubiquinone/menaquinone biosynthesis C-methylase UbiE